ncbi:hypothetical protein N7468_007724 [Penicillium chermesinum]|uniref:Uncharacterized protein n=1 Tax=Penicillium chermesinum TaxID=63820 RepID=A0A9W9NUR6_9EURO|nr:uncharacterized protein N7468_007724 [Penicillium chermesinum]KAJ5226499.1 hypothetical protein N7468_007724 [Penicillium chermesinum]KAJ6160322.1 hypothetical protein N7470_003718 [Penicillium chermesinum]
MSKSAIDTALSSGSDLDDVVKPTLWQRFTAHMKKWWWVHGIVIIVVVLVTVLPLVYVGVPHFANAYINKFQYNETGLAITNPRPNAIHLSQKSKIATGGGFTGSGHLEPFNASLREPSTNQEFAVFSVPEIEFSGSVELDIDQDLELLCVDCMSQLAIAAATNQSLSVLVRGTPDLKYGALPTAHLNIDKTIKMNGYNVTEFLNSPGAFNVTGIDLLKEKVNGYNVNATITIQNPTPFTVELGHIAFNLTIGDDDTPLGYVDLPNVMLEQDVSSTVFWGSLDTEKLIDEALTGSGTLGTVTIGVKGYSCDYNGQTIPYYEAAIKAINAKATLDLFNYASSLFD